jgi:trehalose/maltose hydrolase-like predicted phosphorylase
MRPAEQGLRFVPHIPPGWGSLSMPIAWRGSRLRATAWPDGRVQVALESGGAVRIAIGEDGPWRELG